MNRPFSFAALLCLMASPVLAGCLSNAPAATLAPYPEATLTLDLPIHIVTVGFQNFDEASLRKNLAETPISFVEAQLETTAHLAPDALQYHVTYEVHQAPASFAHDLFAYAERIAMPAAPDPWLAQHDREGLHRICRPGHAPGLPGSPVPLPVAPPSDPTTPDCKDVERIDANKIEAWIAEHRDAVGLNFSAPSYTIFLLDTWDTPGLPKETYHQYAVPDNQTRPAMSTLRAWGGAHDFVFLDVGAAPNQIDFKPWANMTKAFTQRRLVDLTDPPIYEVKSNQTFYANLGRDVSDAAHILWARPPLYRYEYADEYDLPVTVFIDSQAHGNPGSLVGKIDPLDYARHTDQAAYVRAFQSLVPWARVNASFRFVVLPNDDPGMAAALQDAKSRYEGQDVSVGVLKHYLNTHWNDYVPKGPPGSRTYPTFAFVLDAPSAVTYGEAMGDEVGNSWGVYFNIQDVIACNRIPPECNPSEAPRFGTEAAWWEWYNAVLAHEGGHSFGLTHAHDTGSPDDVGLDSYNLNWLWDSTASVMSYRYNGEQFDQFDKDAVLRGNAAEIAREVLAKPATKTATVPAHSAALLARGKADPAHTHAHEALDLIQRGDYQGALDLARQARREASVTQPPVLDATPGNTTTLAFTFPATPGLPPLPSIVPSAPLPDAPDLGMSAADFPIKVPEGAKAIRIEYDEDAAPSHAGWAASLYVTNAEHDTLTRVYDDAHGAVVLVGLDHCASGCTGHLVAYSGAATSYTVKLTPYFGRE